MKCQACCLMQEIKRIIEEKEDVMKYGARNQIDGEVFSIKEGTVMCEVTLKVLTCDFMESVMTMNSLKELAIKKGDKVCIVVKAVNVLLVKE
ncbi:MAG TPA: molybdenum-pterin-binding protein [Syntrophaceae bacterium]|nr:molybdenum-pterin-binding protein [Syntrophaceae bacterium]